MISCSLSPNTEFDDVVMALRVLFAPWVWRRGYAVNQAEHKLNGVSFNSGRSAFLAILNIFGIGRGDEVIVQAFTCVAVPNSVRWSGATPIYADIDESYTMDPGDFASKITKRTKAVVVQHTFGIPAKVDRIIAIAKKNNIKVIEDFAHTMTLPLRGDAGFFSFGRDKVLSSVFGGLAVGPITALKKYHQSLPYPTYQWIFRQLFHPVAFWVILPFYRVGIGKILLILFQRLHMLSLPVYPEEKEGRRPSDFPARYPNALAILLLLQLKKLDRYTSQRKAAVGIYGGNGPLLRFPVRVDHPKEIIEKAKKHGILLGNWYHNVIDPVPYGYIKGTCPRAEDAAAHVINLPTRISLADATRVLSVV
jgi:dTDP-4-amino-4,6-dideoxygalactose transaminase